MVPTLLGLSSTKGSGKRSRSAKPRCGAIEVRVRSAESNGRHHQAHALNG